MWLVVSLFLLTNIAFNQLSPAPATLRKVHPFYLQTKISDGFGASIVMFFYSSCSDPNTVFSGQASTRTSEPLVRMNRLCQKPLTITCPIIRWSNNHRLPEFGRLSFLYEILFDI